MKPINKCTHRNKVKQTVDINEYNMLMMNSLFSQFIDKSEHFIKRIKSKNKDL
jgi:hypothetical protein